MHLEHVVQEYGSVVGGDALTLLTVDPDAVGTYVKELLDLLDILVLEIVDTALQYLGEDARPVYDALEVLI